MKKGKPKVADLNEKCMFFFLELGSVKVPLEKYTCNSAHVSVCLMPVCNCQIDVAHHVQSTKLKCFLLEMLFILITYLSYILQHLQSTLWLNLFYAYDFVVR